MGESCAGGSAVVAVGESTGGACGVETPVEDKSEARCWCACAVWVDAPFAADLVGGPESGTDLGDGAVGPVTAVRGESASAPAPLLSGSAESEPRMK